MVLLLLCAVRPVAEDVPGISLSLHRSHEGMLGRDTGDAPGLLIMTALGRDDSAAQLFPGDVAAGRSSEHGNLTTSILLVTISWAGPTHPRV